MQAHLLSKRDNTLQGRSAGAAAEPAADDSLSIVADDYGKNVLDSVSLLLDGRSSTNFQQHDELLAQTELTKEHWDHQDGDLRRCHLWVRGLDQSFKVRQLST